MPMKSRAVLVAATVFAWLGGLAAASAGPVVSDPTGIIPRFDRQHVLPVLDDMGIPYQIQTIGNGLTSIRAEWDGLVFYLEREACDNGEGETRSDCAGLVLLAFYNAPNGYSLANANVWNDRYYASKATLLDGTQMLISRYLIGDYGTLRGNFAIELHVFKNLAKSFDTESLSLSSAAGSGAPSPAGMAFHGSGAEQSRPAAPARLTPGAPVGDLSRYTYNTQR